MIRGGRDTREQKGAALPPPISRISFYLENWEAYSADPALLGLWKEHYEEIAADKRMPMGPDEEFYRSAELGGQLQITTVRDQGALVGYCLMLVRPHPHYRTVLCGFEDSYFLTKSARRGLVAVKMFRYTNAALAARGVRKVFYMTKLAHDMAKLFEHLGGKESDRVFTFTLED